MTALTIEKIHEYLEYREGSLYWKKSKGSRAIEGTKAGALHKTDKYITVRFEGKKMFLHRLIYELHHGPIPADRVVDHIDRNPLNNCIENLRLCSVSENSLNSGGHKDSKVKVKNVSFNKDVNKYHVRLTRQGKQLVSVFVDTLELAELVAEEARDKYHKIHKKG